jgi:ABC-type dipeptide/oligopeptide/nickel transport system ATPase component
MPDALLDVQKLEVAFKTPDGNVHAVNGVSFALEEGESLGVAAESGYGKSVTMLSILRLIPSPPERIAGVRALIMGNDLLKMSNEEMRHVRGAQIGMVFQSQHSLIQF